MRSLGERIGDAILQEQAEVDRLRAVATKELPDAMVRLKRLQMLLAAVTPALEDGYTAVRAAGVSLDGD